MALLKLKDFDPNYRETFGGDDLNGLDVYTQGTNDKIGTISDVLVDHDGHFRYLVLEIGFWVFGKKVLLPIGRAQHDHNARRVSVSLTKEQAEALPEYNENMAVDDNQEQQVRGVYSPTASTTGATAAQASHASLYDLNDRDHQNIKLYEERLIANKNRAKTGEVAVGKRVETQTAKVSVPIEKERVVVERVTSPDAGKAVDPGTVNFGEGEVARMEIYEETPDIHKEAFVREEVKVTKVVDKETVEAQETLRREELDVNTQGRPVVDSPDKI